MHTSLLVGFYVSEPGNLLEKKISTSSPGEEERVGEREGPFTCPRNWLLAAVHNEGQESQALHTGDWLGGEIPASSLGSQLSANTHEGQSSCSQVAMGCAVKHEPGQRMQERAISTREAFPSRQPYRTFSRHATSGEAAQSWQ